MGGTQGESNVVNQMQRAEIQKYKKCTLVVMNVFCNVGTVQADTTILEECVEAVAVGVGPF